MSSKDREVRQALHIVSSHIDAAHAPFQFRSLASAVYGLRNMSSQHDEVTRVGTLFRYCYCVLLCVCFDVGVCDYAIM